MNLFQIWVMPEDKVKGSHDKWIELETVEVKSRKFVTENLKTKYKLGSWKVRQVV